MKPHRKHAIRQELFVSQNGKCHLCGGQMVLVEPPMPRPPRPDAATIDHLVTKYRLGRAVTKRGNVALACYKCNVRRGHSSVAQPNS